MSTVSVIVCSHRVERWEMLLDALESLRTQTLVPDQVVVVVDGDEALLARLRERDGEELVRYTGGRTGLSNARNTGLAAVRNEFVAFLDDDATAEPTWLESLVAVAEGDPNVLGVGGRTLPRWEGGREPAWFPTEMLWTVGCSHKGLPEARGPVRNVFGGCALFRRDLFDRVGGFDSRLGRKAQGAAGCEETEFCIRAGASTPGGSFVYEPAGVIRHRVHTDRQSPRYVLRRCWEEGRSKAALSKITSGMARTAEKSGALGPEREYLLRVLPQGVASGARAAVRGEVAGLGRAFLLLAGSLVTVAGYLRASTARISPAAGEVIPPPRDEVADAESGVLGAESGTAVGPEHLSRAG